MINPILLREYPKRSPGPVAEDHTLADGSIVRIFLLAYCWKIEHNGTLWERKGLEEARGYALKLVSRPALGQDDALLETASIYKDWGGYGIIAPDFTPGPLLYSPLVER